MKINQQTKRISKACNIDRHLIRKWVFQKRIKPNDVLQLHKVKKISMKS